VCLIIVTIIIPICSAHWSTIFTIEAIYWWLTSPWWITWAILINPFSPQKPFTDVWLPPGELLEPFSSIWLTVSHPLSSSAYLLLVREWLQYLVTGLSKNISISGLMKHKISDTYQRGWPLSSPSDPSTPLPSEYKRLLRLVILTNFHCTDLIPEWTN
jgi:hypothetical protein